MMSCHMQHICLVYFEVEKVINGKRVIVHKMNYFQEPCVESLTED